MSIISWILLGAVVGLVANRLVPGSFPGGVAGTIAGGTAGAFLGGAVFSLVASRGVAGFDLVSLVVAFIGAAALITLVRKADYVQPRT
jgi:uncharacterized membrane protein YeaQ/YmgE (transglycosylase-associated protein family)